MKRGGKGDAAAARKSKRIVVVHPDAAPSGLDRGFGKSGTGSVVPVVPEDYATAGAGSRAALGPVSGAVTGVGASVLSIIPVGISARGAADAAIVKVGSAVVSSVSRAGDGTSVSAANEASGAAWADVQVTAQEFGGAVSTVRAGAVDAMSVIGAGLTAALEATAPAIPLVGAALGLLAAILRQAQRMGTNNEEARQLVERVGRLTALVTEAGRDAGFASRHSAIFDALMGTLAEAEAALAVMADQASISAFARARGEAAKLVAINRALSQHVAEFSAALQAETLSAVRAIHDAVSRIGAEETSASRKNVAAASAPPPPFSMQLRLADFAFDPPLVTQLESAPRGSYGVVVFGFWRAVGVSVAIKLLPARSPSGEQLLTMMAWLGEAETMRRLRESCGPGKLPAHIVLLYGIGAEEDRKGVRDYLVVMERMAGSLRDALDKYAASGRAPALDLALLWILQTALGVAECHQATVVHSDVKAANVLLTDRRDAKLGDMGTARVTRGIAMTMTRGGTATTGGGARGSPLWLAPEMVEDPALAPSMAADVYSWAVTAWEVMSCRLPYHDATGEMVVDLNKLRSKNDLVAGSLRPDLSAMRADAPAALVDLMRRAWASEPRSRPVITDVVAQIQAIVAASSMSRSDCSALTVSQFELPGSSS
jgi:hypothetical protein